MIALDGGGGKFTWGASGKLYEEPEFVDPEDPNYDSDNQGKVKFESITPELSEEHLEKYGRRIIEDYLENGDTEDAIVCFFLLMI
ncbi:unnamed protein product [Soboliphyme baturini]|uniref:N-acetylglucosamine kinase n=1 Tax=Soboliphyme baturini TaxID=241478 RepID=A0A183IF17_9BILA|nr:unnamed protein product [Soboliphyme baturini]